MPANGFSGLSLLINLGLPFEIIPWETFMINIPPWPPKGSCQPGKECPWPLAPCLFLFFLSGICGAQIGAAAARCTVEACRVMELHMKVMKVPIFSFSFRLFAHKSSAVEGCFDFD